MQLFLMWPTSVAHTLSRAQASLLYIWRHSNAMPKQWCALSSIPQGQGDTTPSRSLSNRWYRSVFTASVDDKNYNRRHLGECVRSLAALHLKLIHSNPNGWFWMMRVALSYLQWPSMDMLMLRCVLVTFWRSFRNWRTWFTVVMWRYVTCETPELG